MTGRADSASRPSEGVAEIEAAKRIGGRLCLDFVNTVGGRIRRPGGRQRDYDERVIGERLVSYAALLRWGVLAGAIGSPDGQALARVAAERPAAAAAVLRHAIELREAV